MKFNLKSDIGTAKAFNYLTELSGRHAVVQINAVSPVRTLSQNRYLHLTFGIFGVELGYETEEAKTIYKRYANPEIYVYEKNGVAFLRSSAKLTTKEMSDSLDKWRKYAAEHGVDIPAPNDNEALVYWENRIEQEGKYL